MTHHRLETRMKRNQKWRLIWQSQHTFFRHRTFNVIILNDYVFFENFNRKYFFAVFVFTQKDFSERALSQNCDKIEVRS
jgi:hypothetical protein